MEIRKGECVHHPQYGIGNVQSIRKLSFSGRDEATYAEIYFSRNDLTYTLLKDELPKTVRSLISATEARKLLKQIETWDGQAKPQAKARADKHQAAIESGNPFEYAKVAKELGRIKAEQDLRPRDVTNLAQSLTLLREEITYSLKKSPAQIETLLEKALET